MDMTMVLVGLIIFLAVFTQSLSGFGVALVAMALLPALIDIKVATPLVAIIALTLEPVLLIRYRQSLDMRAVWRMALAGVIGTPLGVLFLVQVDERFSLTILGIVIAGYALYALLGWRLPRIKKRGWAYLAGFLGGVLGGAYNTAGPPVILYGDCRRWPPEVFKGNLQGYFVIASLTVALSHAFSGNLTSQVLDMYWWVLPFLIIGIVAGLGMSRWLDPVTFRKIVLWLLVVMGLRMIF